MAVKERQGMVVKGHPHLSISRQCNLLALNRSSLYYQPRPIHTDWDEPIKREIELIMTDTPYYGSRKVSAHFKEGGIRIGRRRCRRLLTEMNLKAVQPKTFRAKKRGKASYPYLLENLVITEPNQAWGVDITYIPTRYGWTYLIAIMDLFSRMILGWRLSGTMEVGPCVELLRETVRLHGSPHILNQDQGSQFTSKEWTETAEGFGMRMSMAGKGCCYDNIIVERGWRSLKQEEVYLNDYVTLADARNSIGRYIEQYNHVRLHQALGYKTPASLYQAGGLWQTKKPGHQEKAICV